MNRRNWLKRIGVRLILVAGLTGLLAVAMDQVLIDSPDSAIEERIKRQPSRLCPEDPRSSSRAAIQNDDKRTLGEILAIVPGSILVHYRSPGWRDLRDLEDRVHQIFDARPRFLSAHIIWSEGADLRSQAFVAVVQISDGASVRLEAAGYQVCIRDTRGDYWYFRNVPIDVWPE